MVKKHENKKDEILVQYIREDVNGFDKGEWYALVESMGDGKLLVEDKYSKLRVVNKDEFSL